MNYIIQKKDNGEKKIIFRDMFVIQSKYLPTATFVPMTIYTCEVNSSIKSP